MFSLNIFSRQQQIIGLILLTLFCINPSYAQSTCAPDANGDFKPTQSITCQVPDTGEFSYKDVVIPVNVRVTFVRNLNPKLNLPITLKISGNLTVNGEINLTATGGDGRIGGKGGPGGFDGGKGGSSIETLAGGAGDGPGGGAGGPAGNNLSGGGSFALIGGSSGAPHGAAGSVYGTNTLLPLIGGSGGGGGGAAAGGIAGGGGGGGGAILIYCSGTAPATGIAKFEYLGGAYGIKATGGSGGCFTGAARSGSGGSGGAIRLVADMVIGNPAFDVSGGGAPCGNGQAGGAGYIRVEARDLSQFTNGSSTLVTSLTKGPAKLTNTPSLKIKSVGGQTAPANPIGSFYQQPDVTVPISVTNPVAVIIEGTNIPANTTVQTTLTKESFEKETKTCVLTGSPATCSASVTLPTSGVSVITASATLDVLVAFNRPIFIEGERVLKMELAAAFGGTSQVTYITESGRRIKLTE